MAPVRSPQESVNGALGNLARLGTGRLSNSLKKVKTNAKKIEAALPKDFVDKLSKAMPKGTKVEKIDETKLEKDLTANSNDPMSLAKKFNIDTNALSAFGK